MSNLENDALFFEDLKNSAFEKPKENIVMSVEEKKALKEQEKLIKQLEKERIKREKLQEKEEKQLLKEQKKKPAQEEGDSDELFSNNGSEIIGKERRILLKKAVAYKELFKNELKGFKIKKNANEAELSSYIVEMDAIISVSSVDDFLLDSLLSSLKIIEGISAHTQNFDISGLADMLKQNPHFHSLTKQIMLKYGAFVSAPPEAQLFFLTATCAWVAMQKNKARKVGN